MNTIRILLLDDHNEVRERIAERLSHETDLDICQSGSVNEALERIGQCNPDILLIDPGDRDGINLDVLKVIRKMYPKLRIIILTAVVDTSAHIDLSRLGVVHILEKGVSSNNLVQSLHMAMQNQE